MAEIVGGFGVPHTPAFPGLVAQDGPGCETAQLYGEVADHLRALNPDVLLVFDSDHLNTFFLDNMPLLAVGVAQSTHGPKDDTPGLPDYTVPVCEAAARHIRAFGIDHEFDLALTEEFPVDHSILVPLHFLTPRMDVPIVPLFVNGLVPPLPLARRCFALGQMVRAAIEAWPRANRVAVLASGSFTLDVGSPLAPEGQLAGMVDPAWMDEIMAALRSGRTHNLLQAATTPRMQAAGNVAGELLNWIALLGVLGGRKPTWLEPQAGHAYGVWRCD